MLALRAQALVRAAQGFRRGPLHDCLLETLQRSLSLRSVVFCLRDARGELRLRAAEERAALAKKVAHHRAVSFFEKGSGLDRFVELVNETLGASPKARA